MPARLPTAADFPSHLNLTITIPPLTAPRPTNVLLLLHGLGDTSKSFTELSKQMKLPETVCLSLQAPMPLPFDLGGFHWGDDIIFDQTDGQMDIDTGFERAIRAIKLDVIERSLIEKCGYKHREIMMLGFGQGGVAALAAASSITEELGGVISIGGPLPRSSSSKHNITTPLLLLGGSSNTVITRTVIERLRTAFQNVVYHKWQRPGDGMPVNHQEMLPIMGFFARRLRSRHGVPERSIEVA
ncbi:MAG: hypothetical protein Q9163_002304 [Psora crenata]